jgi:hypothetical protein
MDPHEIYEVYKKVVEGKILLEEFVEWVEGQRDSGYDAGYMAAVETLREGI